VLRVGSVPSSPHNFVVLETKAHLGPNLSNLGLGSMSLGIRVPVELDPLLKSVVWHPKIIVSKFKRPCWKNSLRNKLPHRSLLGKRNQEPKRIKMSPRVKRNNEA